MRRKNNKYDVSERIGEGIGSGGGERYDEQKGERYERL